MLSLHWIAVVLAVVGALNWGLVGLFDFDLVAALFGPMSAFSRLVYILVALAGIVLLATSVGITNRSTAHPSGSRA